MTKAAPQIIHAEPRWADIGFPKRGDDHAFTLIFLTDMTIPAGAQPDMFTTPAARKPRQSTKRKAI